MAGIEDARMEDLPPAADATPEQLAALQLAPADSGGAAGDAGKEKKKDKEKRKKAPPSSSSSSSSSESESDSESDSSSESESTDSDDDRRKKKKRSKRSKHSSKKKSSKGGALALLAALKDHPDAYAWCSDYVATRKDLDLATVLKAFTKRFSFEVRTEKQVATQSLVDGTVKMDAHKGVPEYVARFTELVRKAEATDVQLLLTYFRRGLIPDLLGPCRVNASGDEFDSLDALYEHAFSEEKRLRASKPLPSKPSIAFAHAARMPRPQKRSRDHKDKINGNKKGNGDNRKGKANDDAKRRRSNDATAPTGVGSRAASDPDGLSAVNINDRFLTNWQWAHAKKFGKCINCWKTGHRNKDCKESAAEPPVRPTA